MELEPGLMNGAQFVPLADGDDLPLSRPPQGGFVSYLAARARNLDTCRVLITAGLRSPTTSLVAGQDGRSITLVPRSDGWAAPSSDDVSRLANIPLCPDYFAEAVVDVPYTLEVTLQDSRGAAAAGHVSRTVVPRCSEQNQAAQCRCDCAANYTLGGCAVLDAGGF
ncbi:MAG TPA: hypothetical protein VGL13_16705 [Polyangiaceae bacterium]|jgi:hypothetical protein